MPSEITLTSALHNNLQSLQKSKGAASARAPAQIDGNNASETSAQDAINKAAQDFCSQSLSNRACELTTLLENLSQSIKTLDRASKGITKLDNLIKEAETLALNTQKAVEESNDKPLDTAQYEQELGAIEERMDAIIDNAECAGINLLTGDTLRTEFGNNERNTIVTHGSDLYPEGLGFDDISFTSPSSIADSIDIIRSALDETQSLRLTIASDLKDIQTRQDFTQETISTLETGKKEIDITALSEEGANLLALQTRLALSATSLPLASPTQKDVLRLF